MFGANFCILRFPGSCLLKGLRTFRFRRSCLNLVGSHERNAAMIRKCMILPLLALFTLLLFAVTSRAATGQPVDEGWPRTLAANGMTAVVYEPQVDSWDGFNLSAHAAVSVRPDGEEEPVYGVMTFTARTLVDKSERIVTLDGVQLAEARFPSADDRTPDFLPFLQKVARKKLRVIALDRIEAAGGVCVGVAILGEQRQNLLGARDLASAGADAVHAHQPLGEAPHIIVPFAGHEQSPLYGMNPSCLAVASDCNKRQHPAQLDAGGR